MEQMINQTDQNPIMNNSKGQINMAVRKLLVSSALSTAIISWIATAQGLHMYVFNHYWQAAIISAAIQGTLFALSIKAISLMKKLKNKGRIVLIMFWLCILLSSSIFSYVYIVNVVYSSELLKDDSNRIMEIQYMEIYSFLDEVIEWKKAQLENEMAEYITLLATDNGKIKIEKEDKKDLDEIRNVLKNDISTNISSLLDKIESGEYSENDIETLNNMLNNEKNSINAEKEDLEQKITRVSNDKSQKEERLKSFRTTNSPEYKRLQEESESLRNDIEKLEKEEERLRDYSRNLENCQIIVAHINDGLERKLYNTTLNLRKYLNQDEINTADLIKEAESIYEDLFEHNISSNDLRLIEYKAFKDNVASYTNLVEKEETISKNREKIYEIISNDKSEIKENDEEVNPKEKDVETNNDWEKISSDTQDILKDMPQTYLNEFMENISVYSWKYNSTSDILELIMDMDRLYLSDLNDFERAWTLLKSNIHSYKTLLWFSVIFAFGIDLFSFGTGLLLYFMDNEDNKPEEVNSKKCTKCIFSRLFLKGRPQMEHEM